MSLKQIELMIDIVMVVTSVTLLFTIGAYALVVLG